MQLTSQRAVAVPVARNQDTDQVPLSVMVNRCVPPIATRSESKVPEGECVCTKNPVAVLLEWAAMAIWSPTRNVAATWVVPP